MLFFNTKFSNLLNRFHYKVIYFYSSRKDPIENSTRLDSKKIFLEKKFSWKYLYDILIIFLFITFPLAIKNTDFMTHIK